MPLVKLAFWASVAVVFYVYAGYPVLLAAWARLRPRPTRARPDAGALPGISIVVAARNEGKRLAARLRNLIAADYPEDRRQIIVVSDGSTDRTDEIANDFMPAVELVVRPALGKASALNAAVARARHDIIVFADARQTFAPDALRRLVANFSDPSVGAVSGELVLDCEVPRGGRQTSTVGEGVGIYWRYEKWLRRHEALVGSTLGVSGAIYAIRRSCWRPLPPDTILDDVLAPMRAVLAGKRVVFDPSARAFDRTAPDASVESRRKIRTLAGNYQLIRLEPRLLVPFVNPVWLQFVSHKLGRLLVPYALLACFASSAMLARHDPFYLAAFLAQLVVGVLAGYGAVLERRARRVGPAVAAPRAVHDEAASGTKKVVNA